MIITEKDKENVLRSLRSIRRLINAKAESWRTVGWACPFSIKMLGLSLYDDICPKCPIEMSTTDFSGMGFCPRNFTLWGEHERQKHTYSECLAALLEFQTRLEHFISEHNLDGGDKDEKEQV